MEITGDSTSSSGGVWPFIQPKLPRYLPSEPWSLVRETTRSKRPNRPENPDDFEVCRVDSTNTASKPLESFSFSLDGTLMRQLWCVQSFEKKATDRAVVAVVRVAGECGGSHCLELLVSLSFVRKFGEGNWWINSFADGDCKMAVKVVSLAVFADIELVGNGLAARRSRQRVQFPRNGVDRISFP